MGGELCRKDDTAEAETNAPSLITPPTRDRGGRDNVCDESQSDSARRLYGHDLAALPEADTADRGPRDDVPPFDFGRRLDGDNLVVIPTDDDTAEHAAVPKAPGETIEAPLGHLTKKRFTLPPNPRRRHVTWHHQVNGPMASAREVLGDETVDGPRSTFVLQPRVVGTKTVTTTIDYVDGDGASASEQLPDVRFHTPAPSLELVKLNSVSERGTLPVVDRFQIGEELIVTLRMTGVEKLTTADLHAVIANGNLRVTSIVPLGHHLIEVHALPTALGDSAADLYVTPFETTSLDVPPLKLALTIEHMTDKYDYGGDGDQEPGRPRNTDDAGQHLGNAMTRVFSRRIDAVDDLLHQKEEKDPPIERPLWKEIAIALAEAALDAVTAGLGVKFAHAAGRVVAALKTPALHEVAKVFAEETLNAVIGVGGNAAVDRPADAPSLGLTTYFRSVQHDKLERQRDAKVGKARTSAEARAIDLDLATPGEGMRFLMQLTAAMEATADAAYDPQYLRSFEAWCSLLAQTNLAETQSTNTSADSTDLSGVVDIDQFKQRDAGVGVGFCPAAAPIPGVLRVTVKRVPGAGIDTDGPMFAIASTQLPGFTNHQTREHAGKVPLKDLRIPIVVAFSDSEHSGTDAWVFSRDEGGNYLVDPPDSPLLARAATARGDADVLGAARRILEVDLGEARVKPEP